MSVIETDHDSPIIFRTVDEAVYKSSIKTGSIWLRSGRYYRETEDESRKDKSEGANGTKHSFPLNFSPNNGPSLTIEGTGTIGCDIIPHYIVSFHGTSIPKLIRDSFGGFTFGVRNLAKLSAEVLYQVSQQIKVNGYRYGQVAYQYTSLTISNNCNTSAIQLSQNPPSGLKSINTDVLRKDPIEPFIHQDEWRIAIFTDGYLNEDPNEPLKINVDTNHFFEYKIA